MDFIIGLLKFIEVNIILVLVDRFNKMTRFITMAIFSRNFKKKLETTSQIMVSLFFDTLIFLYGVSSSIISNRDIYFTTQFW